MTVEPLPTQDAVFRTSEADAYWRRNAGPLEHWDPAADIPLRLLDLYGIAPQRVIEIGACNGFRLAHIRDRYEATVTGIDPSGSAVEQGRGRGVRMVRGTAARVPLRQQADLVIVNYVLHWIDRSTLLQSVAEIDRLLVDGGFLLLGDFAPANRLQVPYHHRDGLNTYKQDYAAAFLASGLYHPVGMLSHSHAGALDPQAWEHERAATWLLRKQLTDHYLPKGATD